MTGFRASNSLLRHSFLVASAIALAVVLLALVEYDTGSQPREAPGLAAARAAHGLQLLRRDPTLDRVAVAQAAYMALAQNMSHDTARGRDFTTRMRRSGFGRAASENIAHGTLTDGQIITAWLNSPNHRRNMMNPHYSHFGFASAPDPLNPNSHDWSMVIGQ